MPGEGEEAASSQPHGSLFADPSAGSEALHTHLGQPDLVRVPGGLTHLSGFDTIPAAGIPLIRALPPPKTFMNLAYLVLH